MKKNISFICGCIEQGKDGVGDYTFQLAEVFAKNYNVFIIAINDAFVNQLTSNNQSSIQIFRIPQTYNWKAKQIELSKLISTISPEWISLQLVPFGLNYKGIILKAIQPLKYSIGAIPLHLMLHELWLGEEIGASRLNKLKGKIIRHFVLRLIRKLTPKAIHVSCEINQHLLQRHKIASDINPIFSNIKINQNYKREKTIQEIKSKISLFDDGNPMFIAGLFGSIHPQWDFSLCLSHLRNTAKLLDKKLVIIGFGKISSDSIVNIKSQLGKEENLVYLGMDSETNISNYIQLCDLGITSNPEILVSKSGSIAAFWLHGKPVVICRDDLKIKGFETKKTPHSLLLKPQDLIKYFTQIPSKTTTNFKYTPQDSAMQIQNAMIQYEKAPLIS
ncbi:MAG: glycosyltransferase family 1 protein [Cytophagales bacterium]|nr:MAG: glycosyltransferase family 1 protein [Cytophagales bacterium]